MNISFSLTTPQYLDGTKDVTRRMGWLKVKVGDELQVIEKGQGLKKGEKVKILGRIRVVSVHRERLGIMMSMAGYGQQECIREGFPNMDGEEFVIFFCKTHRGCKSTTMITRIEFVKLEPGRG